MKKVTIKELAEKAGVSITTVSRALNGYKDINPKTKARILRLAEEMDYQPSGIARSLVTKKSRTLGLIVLDFTRSRRGHHFLFDIIYGVNDRAADLGYDVVLAAGSPHRPQGISYMELCRRRQLDGVILLGAKFQDPYLHEVLEASIPCVLIDIPLTAERCSFVSVDNVKAAKLAVEHLIGLGHRRIGFINGHEDAYVSRLRLQGYRETMREAGLEEAVFHGNFEEESGTTGIHHLLENHPDLTAVFCASDWMAIGAVNGLKRMNRSIPRDLAVVGFDDIELARYVSPSLTTVHQPRYRFGLEAVNALVRLFEGEKGESVILEPSLMIRESTSG
ncbi:LacI family DNA-binding transcriptional regulator [Staphylospora marina]|uniref:LacI family DNA-binding transcriptional regulator n=1 Tax=Staphylospora marina TaxID=2490858 RepID=UPI000F5C0D51|nr:LacI family DNA-binding transcriptional regulator [Staphylospora marina]